MTMLARGFSSELVAKLQAEELVCFALIDMNLDGTWYRYTDCDVPLVVDDIVYTPAPFEKGSIKHPAGNTVSSFDLKISAQVSGLMNAFVAGTPQGGEFIVRLVFLNTDYYSVYAVNKLTNGDFEAGILTPWSLYTDSGVTASASVVGSGVYEGSYCAKITITDGWDDHVNDIVFKQDLSDEIVVGNLYEVTFAAKADAVRKIALDVGSSSPSGSLFPTFFNIDLTTSWKFFNLSFAANESFSAGTAALNFYLARENSNDDVYIDKVRFSDSLHPVTLFKGYIDNWKLDEDWIEMSVVSAISTWDRKTVRRQLSACRWLKFKGVECEYSGNETWCDRTYDRCQQLSNEDNFGGFPHLASNATKTVLWGRESWIHVIIKWNVTSQPRVLY